MSLARWSRLTPLRGQTARHFSVASRRNAGSNDSFDAKKGSVGGEFTSEGKIGGIAQKVGGPFAADGKVGKEFTEQGNVGGKAQEIADDRSAADKSVFDKDGAVGKMFKADGAIGGIAQKVGGVFSKDGAVGEKFEADGKIGGKAQELADKNKKN